LIYRLAHPPKASSSSSDPSEPLSPRKIFASWLNHLQRPLVRGSGKHLFRLLFPHEGTRRRYNLKEAKLAVELERALGRSGLTQWDSIYFQGEEGRTGCLGKEVELLMKKRVSGMA
jgi:DNA ligase-4